MCTCLHCKSTSHASWNHRECECQNRSHLLLVAPLVSVASNRPPLSGILETGLQRVRPDMTGDCQNHILAAWYIEDYKNGHETIHIFEFYHTKKWNFVNFITPKVKLHFAQLRIQGRPRYCSCCQLDAHRIQQTKIVTGKQGVNGQNVGTYLKQCSSSSNSSGHVCIKNPQKSYKMHTHTRRARTVCSSFSRQSCHQLGRSRVHTKEGPLERWRFCVWGIIQRVHIRLTSQ